MAIVYLAMWTWASRHSHLMKVELDRPSRRLTAFRFGLGNVPYTLAIAVAFINSWASLGLIFLTTMYYLFNQLAPVENTELLSDATS